MTEKEKRIKIYKGFSEGTDSTSGHEAVFVQPDEGDPYPLPHKVRHSPTGFAWGYGGSGPADLARSILADHLGYVPSPGIYQQFKFHFVASWAQGHPWTLTSEEISLYLSSPKIQEQLQEDQELRQWEQLQ